MTGKGRAGLADGQEIDRVHRGRGTENVYLRNERIGKG